MSKLSTLLYCLLLLLSCKKQPEEAPISNAPYRPWTHQAQWRGNTFTYDWKMNSNDSFHTTMPILYSGEAKKEDTRFALELADLDSCIGAFDSLYIRYRSSHRLTLTIALLPEDKHGFMVPPKLNLIETDNSENAITVTKTQFGPDWCKDSVITISQCNNIAFSNEKLLTKGDSFFVRIEEIRIY